VLGIFEHTPHHGPNHVLINEYKRGEGIMPHEDGDVYAPVVATVSLGASLCLSIMKKPGEIDGESPPSPTDGVATDGEDDGKYTVPTRIFQEPRSLLITTGTAYKDLLHGIEAVEVDEELSAETVANWSLLANSDAVAKGGGRNERGTRISLTYRDVLKVSSAASRVFGGVGRR
jgi:alkylated DNA repair protein alkB family protein 6